MQAMIPLFVLSLSSEALAMFQGEPEETPIDPPAPLAGETWGDYADRVALTPTGDSPIPSDAHRWDPWAMPAGAGAPTRGAWIPPGAPFMAPAWQICPLPDPGPSSPPAPAPAPSA